MHPFTYSKRLPHFVANAERHGLSCIAVDTTNNNKVVSVSLNFDAYEKYDILFLKIIMV